MWFDNLTKTMATPYYPHEMGRWRDWTNLWWRSCVSWFLIIAGTGRTLCRKQFLLTTPVCRMYPLPPDASSETQGQSVRSGEKAWRKFSSTGERAPGYRLSPSYFQKFKRILVPGGAQKMLLYYCAQSANSFSHRFIVGCVGAFLLLFPFDF